MTYKTLSSWEWGRGSDPVDDDMPDWLVSILLLTICLTAIGCVVGGVIATPQDAQAKKGIQPKTESVMQKQKIISNDSKHIIIYNDTYVR